MHPTDKSSAGFGPGHRQQHRRRIGDQGIHKSPRDRTRTTSRRRRMAAQRIVTRAISGNVQGLLDVEAAAEVPSITGSRLAPAAYASIQRRGAGKREPLRSR